GPCAAAGGVEPPLPGTAGGGDHRGRVREARAGGDAGARGAGPPPTRPAARARRAAGPGGPGRAGRRDPRPGQRARPGAAPADPAAVRMQRSRPLLQRSSDDLLHRSVPICDIAMVEPRPAAIRPRRVCRAPKYDYGARGAGVMLFAPPTYDSAAEVASV